MSIVILAQEESCYERYFREHNKEILPTIDENDDSYDELKKEVIARQVLRGETPYAQHIADRYDQPAPKTSEQLQALHRPVILAIDTITGVCHLLAEDGTVLADAHIAMVDSIWYMWLSVDPLADKNPSSNPYMYCNGNPIMLVDPDGRDVYQYDNETGDFKLYQKTEDNFDQIGKFTYNRKSGEYLPKLGRDGNIKAYSDHLGNSNQIAKGILKDGLNLRDNGGNFVIGEKTNLSKNDIYNFALILDEVVGKEISGFIYSSPYDAQSQYVQIEPYKNNTYCTSETRLRDYTPNTVTQHFHTHGQASNIMEAITPSPRYDIPAKNKMLERYPTSQFYILHNYGAPIRY